MAVLSALSLLGVVALANAGPATATAPVFGLVIDSEPGDPVGGGAFAEMTPGEGDAFVGTSTASTFTFKAGGPDCVVMDSACDYIVELAPKTGDDWGDVLDGAVLEGTEVAATASAAKLHVHPPDASCTTAAGRFIVDDIEYNSALVANPVTALLVRFEQHCNGDATDPALFGMLSFNESGKPWYARSISPASLDFEGVRETTSKELTLTFTKEGMSDNLDLKEFTQTGAPSGVFAVDSATCEGVDLSATCQVKVTFTPPEDKGYSAVLTFKDQLSPTGRDILMTGFGRSSELTVIGVLNGQFGEQRAGTFSAAKPITLANTGTDDVTIGEPEVVNAVAPPSFAVDDGCTNKVLTTGQSCVISVVAYPNAPLGRTAQIKLNHDAVAGLDTVDLKVVGTGGYFVADIAGVVSNFGDAKHLGDMKGKALNAPMLGITTTSTGNGYWMYGADGGIFSYGNATFHGSTGGIPLNAPVLDMEAEVDDSGYWLAALDGGVFAFDAPFHGSMGGKPLNEPVVGIAAVPDGSGYWLVASDGGIFAFDAPFQGSMGGKPLNSPIVGMASTADGKGYWMVAADGGVFNFNAPFFGSMGGKALSAEVVAIEPTPTGQGYWLLQADGKIHFFGDASDYGDVRDSRADAITLGMASTAPPVNPAGAAIFFS